MSKIPSTQLARAGVVGSTAIKMGVGRLKGKAKRRFLSEPAQLLEEEKQEDQQAELLFKAIAQLRGTAVKLAQMLGMESELLPERVRNELSKTYHRVPPLNRVLVNKIIVSELGDIPNNLFSSFYPDAFAAASLGQVHKAELPTGEQAAVKVQYPGIHVTIESDMKLLKKLSSNGVNFLPKERQPSKSVLEKIMSEISERLMEETDYNLEAENTRWFRDKLAIAGIQVPCVYDQYCSARVITTELLDGQHLDDWLATNPTQAQRNRAAQLIYDLFFTSTMRLGRVHADPNPGNFLIKENGDLALIDFGCVKKLGKRFTENMPELLYAFYVNDFDRIVSAYKKLNTTIRFGDRDDYAEMMRPFGEWMSKPIKDDSFDFKENSNYTHQAYQFMQKTHDMPGMETLDEDFIFFDRTLYGLFKIFERLEATVYMRYHWEPYWDLKR